MDHGENFRNFLITYNAYEAYCFNIREQKGIPFSEAVGDGTHNLNGIIDQSFTWDQTPENHDFWSGLNSEWNQACKDGKIFAPSCKSIW